MDTGMVTLIGIALTFLVAVLNLIYSITNNKKTRYVNTVTTSRMKWIDSLRDKVSAFIAVTIRLLNPEWVKREPDEVSLLIRERDTLMQQIILHLNPDDPVDQALKGMVKQVFGQTARGVYSDDLATLLIQLRDATAAYIKKEWEKVKKESQEGQLPKEKAVAAQTK